MPVTPMSAPTPMTAPGPAASTPSPMPQPTPAQDAGLTDLAGMDNQPGMGAMGMGGAQTEKQAIDLLMQGAQMFDQAIKLDPGLYFMRDELEKLSMKVARYYGSEEEMKLSIKRAKETMPRGGGPSQPPPMA